MSLAGRIGALWHEDSKCRGRSRLWALGLVCALVGCGLRPSSPSDLQVRIDHIDAFCDSPGSATARVVGGESPYLFRWSDGQETATASGLAEGNYSVLVIDSAGGFAKGGVKIGRQLALEVNVETTDVSCHGASDGTATAIVAGGAPSPFTYHWEPTGQSAATATGLAAGSYRVTVAAAGGCQGSASVDIEEPPPLVVTTTTSYASCDGTTVSGSAGVSASGGTPPYSIEWDFDEPCEQACADACLIGVPPGTYGVEIVDANGCAVEREIEILPAGDLKLVADSTAETCAGAADGTATVEVAGGTPPFTFEWDDPGRQTTARAVGLGAGTYRVRVSDSSQPSRCVAATEVAVAAPPPLALEVTVTPDRAICRGQAVTLAARGKPGLSYRWSPDDGTLSCSDCQNPTVRPMATTTYTVEVQDPHCPGAPARLPVTVTVVDAFGIAVEAIPASVCSGEETQLVTRVEGADSSGLTFRWSPAGSLSDPALASPVARPDRSTTYTVTASNGVCSRSAAVDVEVRPRPAVRTAELIPLCRADLPTEVTLAAGGAGPEATYSWSPAAGLSDPASPRPILEVGTDFASTAYTVTVEELGCAASSTVMVAVGGDGAALTGPSEVCAGGSVSLTVSGGVSYLWSGGPGSFSCTRCAAPFFTPAGEAGTEAVVSVAVTDGLGCPVELEHRIRVARALAVTASADQVVCPGEPVELAATVSGDPRGPIELVWSPPNGLSCTRCANPTAVVSGATTYTVTATDGRCSANDQVTLDLDGFAAASFTSESSADRAGAIAFEAFPRAGISSYRWDFGDGDAVEGVGGIAEPGANDGRTLGRFDAPVHRYQTSGIFRVCLTLSSRCGTRTLCDPVKVENVPCATCKPGDRP